MISNFVGVSNRANRLRALAALVVVSLSSASCSDEPLSVVGAYRLESVDGVNVPFAVGGQSVRSGDLVLRGDNTAQYVVRTSSTSWPVVFSGVYRLFNARIELASDGIVYDSGSVSHNTVSVKVPFYRNAPAGAVGILQTAVFRRVVPDPVAVTSGTYQLTTVWGRPIAQQPLYGARIEYDILQFSDGVFYSRSYKATSRDSVTGLSGEYAYTTSGTYRGNAHYLLLGEFSDTSVTVASPTRDSLIVSNGILTLRSWAPDGTVRDNRYEREP